MFNQQRTGSLLVIFAFALAPFATSAESPPTPYAGLQARSIKALSDREASDLKMGRGMGLALAAELNGYPGPSHLLELADRLGLSSDQRASIKQLFDAMKAETVPLGEGLIAKEAELDSAFSKQRVTQTSLTAATAAIGEQQAALRNAHLKYHLLARALLQPSQLSRYTELRGYGDGSEPDHAKHH